MMSLNVGRELAVLEASSVLDLRRKYEEVFREACRSNHKTWLVKRIIWRMQANEEGDLTERARQRAAELANDADLRLKAPPEPKRPAHLGAVTKTKVSFSGDDRLPLPGAVLIREYKGKTVKVMVLNDGFEWEGTVYKSLSSVAKAITGTHTSGYLFFKLAPEGAQS
jgi:hypothetical protein